jgi:PAS domain S-box-containing protein
MEEDVNPSGESRDSSWRGQRLSEQTFRRLFEAVPGLYLVLDPELTVAQLERRTRQLEILTTAAQEINSSLQIPDIMRRLVRLSMELVEASEGTWGRMSDGHMTFTEYLRSEGQIIEPHFAVFEREMGVPGHVMVTKQPYISNDAANDPHVLPHLREAIGFYNLIDLPIFNRSGELVGCFELHNKRGRQPFTAEDLELLKGLRASAAVALENAQLYETVQTERRTLNAIVQQMPAGLTLAEAPSGRLIYYNQEMERLLGHPALALDNHEQYALAGAVHEDLSAYRSDEYPIVRSILRGEIVQDEEMLYRRGGGGLAHLSVTAAPIRDAEGRITQAVSVFIDISARKQAEAALQDERMWLEALLDRLPVPLTLIDPSSGEVTFRNEEAKKSAAREGFARAIRVGPQS